MSKLTAMLKWAMRIIAVSGALLAIAVGTTAWMHRTQGREWVVGTPKVCSMILISPRRFEIDAWLRSEWDNDESWHVGRYGVESIESSGLMSETMFQLAVLSGRFGAEWHGFGFMHGDTSAIDPIRSFTKLSCPTSAMIALLLLPMGLWSGIAWRQRRRVKAGHCVSCGYDLRASPERCPECGRDVKKR